MADVDARTFPLDSTSFDDLASRGLSYALVPPDGAGFDAFLSAVSRGFLDAAPTAEQVEDSRSALRDRRMTGVFDARGAHRSEEHTSELQSLMLISYAVFCLKPKNHKNST